MDYVIPVVLAGLVVFGLFKKVNVFEAFTDGAREGLHTVYTIAPTMIGLITAVGMVKASGLLDIIVGAVKPLTDALGYPSQLVPMAVLRPMSGSGATAVLTAIFEENGADSFVSKCAAVLSGSTETTFYAVTMYYGAVGVKKIRHTLFSAILADLTAMVMSVVTVTLLMG